MREDWEHCYFYNTVALGGILLVKVCYYGLREKKNFFFPKYFFFFFNALRNLDKKLEKSESDVSWEERPFSQKLHLRLGGGNVTRKLFSPPTINSNK